MVQASVDVAKTEKIKSEKKPSKSSSGAKTVKKDKLKKSRSGEKKVKKEKSSSGERKVKKEKSDRKVKKEKSSSEAKKAKKDKVKEKKSKSSKDKSSSDKKKLKKEKKDKMKKAEKASDDIVIATEEVEAEEKVVAENVSKSVDEEKKDEEVVAENVSESVDEEKKDAKPASKGRDHTISIALPASIIANAQSFELRSYLVGQIARALTIFNVDEVVIYEDQSSLPKGEDGVSQALSFFVRNLQYLETPQYLRRSLFQIHKDLKFAGLQNPLDAPHHMRMDEWSPYREGSVASVSKDGGCWVNCGLQHDVWIAQEVEKNVRLTVKINRESWDAGEAITGKPVSPEDPRTKKGLYWGYKTRVAASLKEALEGSSYDEGYDLMVGTSERGQVVDHEFKLPKFKHLLLVFGGLGGLEEVLEDDICQMAVRDPSKLFGTYVNACVNQGSRTIRSEEALLVTLSLLRPTLMRN